MDNNDGWMDGIIMDGWIIMDNGWNNVLDLQLLKNETVQIFMNGSVYSDRSNLQRHVKMIHAEKTSPNIKCDDFENT